jgi:hypothetical protein
LNMSENEKREQIGTLVEEYSHLKGLSAQANEKLQKSQQAFQFVGNNFQTARVVDGRLNFTAQRPGMQATYLDSLLNETQFVEALIERDRLNKEILAISEQLKPLAPHLF